MQRIEKGGSRQNSSLRGQPIESLALAAPLGLRFIPALYTSNIWQPEGREHKNWFPCHVDRVTQQRVLFKAVLIRAVTSEK
jgi:hypothetical protein